MNFAGPFVSEQSHVSPVSLGGDGFTFNKPGFIQHNPSDTHVVIPDAHLLFSGEYTRIGSDLIISGDGQKIVVGNYFKGETRPALTSKDGATLAGHIVDALTGHVHHAQANTAAPGAGQVIGNVLKLSGSATAIRNGVSIELHIGDAIQKGDVIQTGSDSSIGMTFVDGSAFGMTSNARMVMNEMIYDPNGSSNSSLISLVQGTITFVAGQTAKNGNMRVETPVATMGIRGTAVLVEIGANDGPTKFSVLVEPDGYTGSYNLYDKITGLLIGTVSQAGQVTYVTSLGLGQPPSAIEQLKTLQDQQNEKSIIQQVFQLYFPNYNPDDSNPKSPKFGHNTSGNNLAEILFTTNSNQQKTFLTQIELRFAVTDPVTGAVTYQSKIFYNAKASFWADSVFGSQAFVSTTESFKFADVVKIDDPDIGNAPFYDIGIPFVAGSAIIKSAVSTIPQMSETFLKSLLSINQTTGVVSFDRQQFNFLDDGQTVTFKIQVTAASGPDTGVVEIPVTITGENDAPTIVIGDALHPSVIAGAVTEDIPSGAPSLSADGIITFQDFDLTDAHTASVALTSTASSLPHFVAGTEIGHFTIDPVSEDLTNTDNHGSVGWHFTLADNDPTLQSLAKDQTITQTYTITIKDNNGVEVTQTVTITITGTNDAPVLSADTSVHQADEVPDTTGAPNSTVDIATGTLAFLDVDLSDTHTASAALHPGATSVVWSGGNYNDIPQATRDALNNAVTASVSEDNTDTSNQGSVGWKFELPDHLFDFLADGETLTLIYDVTVTDNNGVSSTQQITVQIGAANDQPVISVIDGASTLQEDVGVQPGNLLSDSGSVTFTDTDLTDTHTAHVTFNGAFGGNGASVSPALLTALGTALSVPSSALATGVHTFGWDFALDNNLVQYLGAGETVTVTYTVTVQDSSEDANDTSAGQTVTVVIAGTNDTPVITAVDVSGAVQEDIALAPVNLLHDNGSVTFADADATDHEAASVAFVSDTTTSAAAIPGTLHTALQGALTLQNDSFTSNSGTIHWDFNLDNSLVQYLADGETITVTYTITVKDDSGTATDTSTAQTVTIVITGTNDAPVVSGVVTDLTVVEDGSTSTLAALANASDVDNGAVLSVVNVPGTLPPGVTYDAVNHTFTLDPGHAAYQHLADGQTTVVTVNYGVTDGIVTTPTAASVSWTITGTNDAPTVSGAVTAIVAEDASASTLDALLNASDVDDGAVLTVVNVPDTLPAGVTYDAVHHTFTLDPTDAAYQHLGVGQSAVVTVDYAVTDGTVTTPTPASVSWTVTGTNDAPTVAAVLTDTVSEGDSPFTTDLLTGAVDIDDGDTLSVVNVTYKVGTAPASGTAPDGVSLTGSTLSIDPTNASFDHLGANEHTTIEVSYDIKDTLGLLIHQTDTVEINGVNDAPVLNVDSVTPVELGGGVTKVLGVTFSDIDAGADTFTVTATADHGTVSTADAVPVPLGGSGVSGSFTDVGDMFTNGAVYTPDNASPTDKVTLTVTDSHGGSDTVNFIFKQFAPGGVTLEGTAGKDWIVSSTGNDTMTGAAGHDNFVFAPSSGQDEITDFTHGDDKIDLHMLTGGPTVATIANWLATATESANSGSDTLLHLNGNTDTVLLKGVTSLSASDFILHA